MSPSLSKSDSTCVLRKSLPSRTRANAFCELGNIDIATTDKLITNMAR